MKRGDLLKSLQPGGKEVLLSPTSSSLGQLGVWLKDGTGPHDQIVITAPKVDAQAPEDSLILRGKAELLGVETTIKAVFQLAGGTVARYYLIAALPADWRLEQSFPGQLPGFRGKTSFFGEFQFEKPLLVLAAQYNVITDAEHRFAAETFDNGLNLYAAGLSAPLPVSQYGVDSLPAFGKGLDTTPSWVKGKLQIKAKNPEIQVLCWYGGGQAGKLGAASVLSMGLGFRSAIGAPAAEEPIVSWLWELQIHPDEAPFVVVAQMPRDRKRPPTFKSVFDSARHLTKGINALSSLAGDQDLSAAIPCGGGPSFSLASLSLRPGELMTSDLVLLDSGTGEPYEWEVVDDLVRVKNVVLSVTVLLEPMGAPQIGVSGTAEIGGY